MNASVVVHTVTASALPVADIKAWRADLVSKLQSGQRLLTMYGRPADDEVVITTVLQAEDRTLQVLRTRVQAQLGYHALTSEHPALHCFERELHEQTGLRVAGHPWLKPLRFEGQPQAAMNDYPFYRIEGKEVHEVAVGPIHAGVIEPGSFRFMCLGEQVHHLEIQLGYQHRGVERRLLQGKPTQLAPLVETIAGDSSVAHTWAYCAALEQLCGCELPIEVEVARAVGLELERVAMHLATLSGLAADIGFLQGATSYGRLRTTAINTLMRLCGSRFGRGALRPGGVGLRLSAELVPLLLANLELLRNDLAIINECFVTAHTVKHRLRAVGVLTHERALALGIVGVAARASGVACDARDGMSRGAYQVLPVATCLAKEGDCYARALVRIAEMDVSLAWLSSILALYPRWDQPRKALTALAPDQLVVSMVEGFRGEVVHCLETGGSGELVHYKVQDPSLRNWMGLAIAVRDNEISDFPICNKSFDLSYCGHDL
ncbi:MAG TPA: hypothetical protein VF331_25870 [Polyangiales bacterium]